MARAIPAHRGGAGRGARRRHLCRDAATGQELGQAQLGEHIEFDTSDVDGDIAKPGGGGQLEEPVTVTDIRRRVQAMQYPNPLHHDEGAAARSTFGRTVPAQSLTICRDAGHGAGPAIVGRLAGERGPGAPPT